MGICWLYIQNEEKLTHKGLQTAPWPFFCTSLSTSLLPLAELVVGKDESWLNEDLGELVELWWSSDECLWKTCDPSREEKDEPSCPSSRLICFLARRFARRSSALPSRHSCKPKQRPTEREKEREREKQGISHSSVLVKVSSLPKMAIPRATPTITKIDTMRLSFFPT